MQQYQLINIQLIDRPNPPVRLQFDGTEIQALVESIREKGILVPLLVAKRGDRYEVIDGDCRLEAAYRLRSVEIPCVVRDATDREIHVLRMLANLDRSNPDVVSEATYCAKVIASGALSLEEFAAKLNRSPEWVEDRLTIAEMPEYMQELLRTKQLSLGVALEYAKIDDETTQHNWVISAVRDGATIRTARDAVRQYQSFKEIWSREQTPPDERVIPQTPPVVLYPCAKCGRHDNLEALQMVRIHAQECGIDVETPSA